MEAIVTSENILFFCTEIQFHFVLGIMSMCKSSRNKPNILWFDIKRISLIYIYIYLHGLEYMFGNIMLEELSKYDVDKMRNIRSSTQYYKRQTLY
ncbi:hypothetical protein F4703DRAFT_1879520 [Phycomyces blakesleeanus]